SAVWDPLTPTPLSSRGGLVSAVAIAPSQQGVYYAGTDKGEIFVTRNHGADFMPERDAGLPVGLPGVIVNGITIDPNNSPVAYAMLSGTGIAGHVWRTSTSGTIWGNLSSNLPNVNAYSMVVDPRPGLGAPMGKLYVATEIGIFVSINSGSSWSVLGQGLPHV